MRGCLTKSTPTQMPRRGTVILLSLLVLSSVVIAAAGLGSLILSSLQQTRIIDSAIIAYYAAESSVEEALYLLRRGEDVDPASLSTADPQPLGNGATWQRQVGLGESVVRTEIPRDSFQEFTLFDPDAMFNEAANRGLDIAKIVVDWAPEAGCGTVDLPCPRLNVTVLQWQRELIAWSENAAKTSVYTSTPEEPRSSATIALDDPLNRFYKLRLRADDADLRDVAVSFYDSADQLTNVPGRVLIQATGDYGGTRQQLTVRLPRKPPLSGIFDFAIFSECSVVKGYPISCP